LVRLLAFGYPTRTSGRVLTEVRRPKPAVSRASLEGLKKVELVELAEAQGVDTSGTKADIAARLTTPESNDADVTVTDA